ncbi:MAG: HAD family hydrolase [Chloroflexi bacterium]|nr:HAD family hydrolase [Chloroflexota bacterium]
MQAIRAVFFDFYNTVARFDPPRERLQSEAAALFGLSVDERAVRDAYPAADEFLSYENGERFVASRSQDETTAMWARYEQILMAAAGLDVDLGTAGRLFQEVRGRRQGFTLFDDVLPTLAVLHREGYRMGLLSNMNDDLTVLSTTLGLDRFVSFALTSSQVGAAKPHAPIFLEALRRADVQPNMAIHVGDQYHGDVMGAKGVGIRPVLIDRDGIYPDIEDCRVIRSLDELPELLKSIEDGSKGG